MEKKIQSTFESDDFSKKLENLKNSKLGPYFDSEDSPFQIISYQSQKVFRLKFNEDLMTSTDFEKKLLATWPKVFKSSRPYWFQPRELMVEIPIGKEEPELVIELLEQMGIKI